MKTLASTRITLFGLSLGMLLSFTFSAAADVRLPALFSDHMVLQSGRPAPVWGWADSGEEVTVQIAGQMKTVKAGAHGDWKLAFKPLASGGPHTLEVQGKNTIQIDDVLVGEVWLGSGQSNMAMLVRNSKGFEQEQAVAELPQIRMFTVTSGPAESEQTDCKGAWQLCSPETVGNFSATAFFFGREIHKSLGVPVGLINSSVGGTPIESWIRREAQQESADLKPLWEARRQEEEKFDPEAAKRTYERQLAVWKEAVKKARTEGMPLPRAPRDPVALRARKGNLGGLFNGKIAPLAPYAIRGALWYQGEANSSPASAPFYRHQLPLLVNDWRARWGYEFPFAWVQLPNYGASGRSWPIVREAMLETLKLKDTGMAITIDIGEAKDIHPKNKQDVGRRLSLWALGEVYGMDVAATSGPLPTGHKIDGNKIIVSFSHAEGGLAAKDGELTGFVIAGEDKQWQPAQARIDGATVIVSSPDVPKPVAVRYAWENFPACNLYNAADLPASPFRTDDWE